MKLLANCSLIILFVLKATQGVLVVQIARTNGSDTKCLKHLSTPCRSLKFALQHVLASNEKWVDISFIEDLRYPIDEPLQIHTSESKVLHLRLFSKLPSPSSGIILSCSNAQRIFDVNGPYLTLEFHNISFKNCGQGDEDVVPAITVNHTNKVSFFSCTFQENLSGAFFAMNSDVHIEHSTFQNNSIERIFDNYTFSLNVNAFGGGVGILFQNGSRNMSVNVFQTRFIDNRVHVIDSKYYVAQERDDAAVRGGGVHISFRGTSKFSTTVNITSCHFEKNRATFGGGLIIKLLDNALNNKIFITATQFTGNHGGQGGGGFVFAMVEHSGKTSLTMRDVLFQENFSKSGGGVLVVLRSEYKPSHETRETLLFKRLQFIGNSGPAASSIKIESHLFGRSTVFQIPVFESCSFIGNSNPPFNRYAFLPSFVVDRVDVILNGTNVFADNTFSGAILFSNSHIDVFGKLHFLRNIGVIGGALSMQNSQITLHRGTDILFRDNYAFVNGGAINVITNAVYHVGVVDNPDCFLVYSDQSTSPEKWNVSVRFIHNSAGAGGPAVSIDSLMMCAWDAHSQKLDFNKALRSKPTFHYEGNVLCSDPSRVHHCRKSVIGTSTYDISTSISNLEERNGIQSIETSPGEETVIDLIAKDELNNSVVALVFDTVMKNDVTKPQWMYINETFTLIGEKRNTKVHFRYFSSNSNIPANTTAYVCFFDTFSIAITKEPACFTIYPQPCRPGFIQNGDSCVCDKTLTGVMGCTEDGQYVQYEEGYWAGLVEGVFTLMPCPFGYCSCPRLSSHQGTARTGCFYNATDTSNDTAVCANKRSGPLCGNCQENHTVSVQTFRCVPTQEPPSCVWTNVFSFLFTALVCFCILYFNPGLDNALRGPLFFFQVLPLFLPPLQYTTKGSVNVYDVVVFVASIFKFTIPFFSTFFAECYILKGGDNLNMLAWSYSSFIIALFVCLFALLLSRKRVITIRRRNAVQCFWVLLIFMYTNLISVSLRIVDCPLIQGKRRLFLQASLTCYEGKHLYLSIVAYLLLICGVVVPMLIFVFTKTSLLKIAPHYLDTMTANLKQNCVFWWSIDLLRRFFIVALGKLLHVWEEKQIALVLATMFILCIHCYCQPYEETLANIAEMIFLFVLAVFGVIQLLHDSEHKLGRTNDVILCIMLGGTLLLVSFKAVLSVRRRMKSRDKKKAYERLANDSQLPATPSALTNASTDESLEERRERLAFLFNRSDSLRTRGNETQRLINEENSS